MDDLNKKTAILSIQLSQLMASFKSAIFVSIVVMLIFVYIMSDGVNPQKLHLWLTLALLVAIVRIIFFKSFLLKSEDSYSVVLNKLNKFRAGTLAAGLAWGSAG